MLPFRHEFSVFRDGNVQNAGIGAQLPEVGDIGADGTHLGAQVFSVAHANGNALLRDQIKIFRIGKIDFRDLIRIFL